MLSPAMLAVFVFAITVMTSGSSVTSWRLIRFVNLFVGYKHTDLINTTATQQYACCHLQACYGEYVRSSKLERLAAQEFIGTVVFIRHFPHINIRWYQLYTCSWTSQQRQSRAEGGIHQTGCHKLESSWLLTTRQSYGACRWCVLILLWPWPDVLYKGADTATPTAEMQDKSFEDLKRRLSPHEEMHGPCQYVPLPSPCWKFMLMRSFFRISLHHSPHWRGQSQVQQAQATLRTCSRRESTPCGTPCKSSSWTIRRRRANFAATRRTGTSCAAYPTKADMWMMYTSASSKTPPSSLYSDRRMIVVGTVEAV